MAENHPHPWLAALDEEDLAFLKRFLLSSGSLKEIAGSYGVSYPTVRLRLDRLIQKVEVADELTEAGPFERTLRLLLAEGTIDAETFRELRRAHEQDKDPGGAASRTNRTPTETGK